MIASSKSVLSKFNAAKLVLASPEELADVVESLFRKQGLSTAITSGGSIDKMFVNVRIAGVVGNGLKYVNLSVEREGIQFTVTWNLEYCEDHQVNLVDKGESMAKTLVRTINRVKDSIDVLVEAKREIDEDIKLLTKIKSVVQIMSTLKDPK